MAPWQMEPKTKTGVTLALNVEPHPNHELLQSVKGPPERKGAHRGKRLGTALEPRAEEAFVEVTSAESRADVAIGKKP